MNKGVSHSKSDEQLQWEPQTVRSKGGKKDEASSREGLESTGWAIQRVNQHEEK